MSKRVLYVAYHFPPVGGAGVQRTVKFVKYLPESGWIPSVLTVANPSVPVYDASLAADVPEGTEVRTARTWEPGYTFKAAVSAGHGSSARPGWWLRRAARTVARRVANVLLQPDPQVLWLPHAVREGLRILAERSYDAIIASAPPFSSFLVGASLSRRTGVPLVLDYRDEWDLSNAYWENKRHDPLSAALQTRMQRRVVRTARAVIASTCLSADALRDVCVKAGSAACVGWIYNGYDPDDFPPPQEPRSPGAGPYRLAYVGTLWALTSVAPVVEAVRLIARRDPGLLAGLELVFAGRRTGPQQDLLGQLQGLPCRVVEFPYVDHHSALDLVRSSDGLCLLLSDLPGAGRVVPAKVFEYMASRRSVLAVAPRGEVWDLLDGHPSAFLREPSDTQGIAEALSSELARHREGRTPSFDGWDPSRFDRRNQAGQLAGFLDALEGTGRRGPASVEPCLK